MFQEFIYYHAYVINEGEKLMGIHIIQSRDKYATGDTKRTPTKQRQNDNTKKLIRWATPRSPSWLVICSCFIYDTTVSSQVVVLSVREERNNLHKRKNIIYSYKYLESDLIKHCHVIFIHSFGQPLIVRSHSKVHRSRGNQKETPTWASRVSNYSYFPWFNRQQAWRPATGSSL